MTTDSNSDHYLADKQILNIAKQLWLPPTLYNLVDTIENGNKIK
ncbi:hypothetical protein CZ794_06765 [Psychrobacter sp. JB385]|nr:hypothetical protein CZ794_06765 [Psychrobacter sp. JB385]